MNKHTYSHTHRATICVSGPANEIEQSCRKFCLAIGLCVTVTPTKFIFSGGEETGVEIGLLNYPRFPKDGEEIDQLAISLATLILERTFQRTALVVTPDQTTWIENSQYSKHEDHHTVG